MIELSNGSGEVCACLHTVQEDGVSWAVRVAWKEGVPGLPLEKEWDEAMSSCIRQCREGGAFFIDSRVITASEGIPDPLMDARASMHREYLTTHGFQQGESRVEFLMSLDEALTALDSGKTSPRLLWNSVKTEDESELARAAHVFHRASEGDPASRPEDDALGFLKAFLADEDSAVTPLRLQIGSCEGLPAVVLALVVHPDTGWSSIAYLGVVPGFRGRGFGAEAMLHGLRCLKAMGGVTYHDGTGAENAAALALFSRLGRPPFRRMEEWRLEIPRP